MSEQTKIKWADSTVNFWQGCTKVSAGCANCYAEARDARFHGTRDSFKGSPSKHWGKGADRLKTKGAVKDALAYNRKPWICDACGHAFDDAEKADTEERFWAPCSKCTSRTAHRRRIFSLSLGDWLDPEVPIEWLAEMLDTIRQCDQVEWILCTKRPENFFDRLRAVAILETISTELFDWLNDWQVHGKPPANITLLTSVENQEQADTRIPELLRIPSARRGLSLEPLLGPVDLTRLEADESLDVTFNCLTGIGTWNNEVQCEKISWLILGGESGPNARPCNVDWIRSLVQQGTSAGVATFVKQLGAKPFIETCPHCDHPEASHGYGRTVGCQHGDGSDENPICGCRKMRGELCHGFGWPMAHHPIKDKKGADINEWPEDLRVQEWAL